MAKNPSKVKTFNIESIMEHIQETSINPINTSSSIFGVMYENQFAVLDDGKHVIGVDASDGRNLIIENVENGKADKFGWRRSSSDYITTLVYDEKTGFLYSGYKNGHLNQYKIDTASKSCQRVKNCKDDGICEIRSSYRFLEFVFFGGSKKKIRVFHLSTGELLPESLETSIWYIYSLQVCVKKQVKIFLAVSGVRPDYSDDKTDLFDISALFQNNQVTIIKYLSKYLISNKDNILAQSITLKSRKIKIKNRNKKEIRTKSSKSK